VPAHRLALKHSTTLQHSRVERARVCHLPPQPYIRSLATGMAPRQLGIQQLASEYAAGLITPSALIQELYPALAGCTGVFIHLLPLQQLLERCAELEAQPVASRGMLWGVPFAVKDNVDVAGMPTTAACPAFSYSPTHSSPAVEQLLTAGACGATLGYRRPRAASAGSAADLAPVPSPIALLVTCAVDSSRHHPAPAGSRGHNHQQLVVCSYHKPPKGHHAVQELSLLTCPQSSVKCTGSNQPAKSSNCSGSPVGRPSPLPLLILFTHAQPAAPPLPPQVVCVSARPIWTSLPAAWWAHAPPTAQHPTPLTTASSREAPPPAQQQLWGRGWSALRWGQTRPAAGGCQRATTAAWG
jgi:hypothetical protein